MDPKDLSNQPADESTSQNPPSDQNKQSSQGSAPFLTDPVMPEQPSNTSQPQASEQNEPEYSQSLPQPPKMKESDKQDKQKDNKQKTKKAPQQEKPPSPPKSPPKKHTPAQPPSRSSLKPVLLIAVILIVIAALGAGAYFYMQNQALKDQLDSIQANLQPTSSPTPTPTPTPTINPTASPDSYPTVEITSTPTETPSPQPTISNQDLTAFSSLEDVVALAQQNHPQAQLLMITSDNILSSPVYKYWFRNQPDLKDYFYVKLTPLKGLEYISYATVTPDNNIPDLIPFWQEDNLGQSDQQLLSKAQQEIDKQTDQDPSSIAVKFIRSRPSNPDIQDQINLWQFSFKFSNQNNLIVQYNAQNQQLVYKNF